MVLFLNVEVVIDQVGIIFVACGMNNGREWIWKKYFIKKGGKIYKLYKVEYKNINILIFRESLNNNRLEFGSVLKKQGIERELYVV